MRRLLALLTFAVIPALLPDSAPAAEVGEHSDNLRYVKNIPYPERNGGTPNFGTDIEFAKIAGRQYALAGSYKNGMQIVDITSPADAATVATYDCGVTQGDVQIFRQADKPGRVFAGYASDTFGDGTSTCYREAAALGFDVLKEDGTGKNGTFIVELTNPPVPKTVSFVGVEQGTHNHSIHPSGKYLYNSNSDLITSVQPAIEIFDISNFAAPRKLRELALPTRPGLGTESHDITFDTKGDRAYSAALSQGVIINTADPARPTIVSTFLDPSINVWHQMDPFTMTDAQGHRREFLIAEDEVAGAVGTGQCPNGGVHVYEITDSMETSPQKVGYWNIDDVRATDSPDNSCTAHVFDIHEREQMMTIAYYNGGVHVVDISGLMGISLGDSTMVGGPGMRELGYYRTTNADGRGFADTWSFKSPKVSRSGDFYAYGNDIARGLDVYRFSNSAARSTSTGRWMTPKQAATFLSARPRVGLTADTAFFCLLPPS